MRNTRLAILIAIFVVSVGHAQQTATPQPPQPAGQSASSPSTAPQRGVLGPAPGFTGRTTTLDTTGYTIGRRVFEAGSHNATWHMHTAGQLLFAESGRGRLHIPGQPIRELAVGDSAFIPGGVFHWHRAPPNENFTMVFINLGETKTTQGEPVSEEIYLGKK